jgi:hypothetical protein
MADRAAFIFPRPQIPAREPRPRAFPPGGWSLRHSDGLGALHGLLWLDQDRCDAQHNLNWALTEMRGGVLMIEDGVRVIRSH